MTTEETRLYEAIREAVSHHLPQSRGAGRWPGCFTHPTVVDWTPDHIAEVVAPAVEGIVAERVAQATAESPHCSTCSCGCTCGYGGQHDPDNPRCELNESRFRPDKADS